MSVGEPLRPSSIVRAGRVPERHQGGRGRPSGFSTAYQCPLFLKTTVIMQKGYGRCLGLFRAKAGSLEGKIPLCSFPHGGSMVLTAYPSSQSHPTERSTRLGQGPPMCRGHLRMDRKYYAHSLPNKPKEEWQRLEEHRNILKEDSMAGKLSYERYHWFHGRVKAGAYPNARTLAKKFEISPKQAQRDIEFIRDRLGAPVTYNRDRRGYRYDNASYELPPVWLKEDELVALSLALRLAAAIPDREFKSSLHHLLEAVMAFRSTAPPGFKEVEEKVSVKNIEYYRVREPVFHAVVGALFQNKPLKITYHTPHTGEKTDRLVQPLHLLCYMGSWHLIAFCTLRRELRDFALSRFISVETSNEKVKLPSALPSVKEHLRMNFGVIAGGKSTEVILKFKPNASPWVSEQVWHDAQQIRTDEDGSVHLTFPVAGFEEVAREILKYGAGVEVLKPEALRELVGEEIRKMGGIYVRK